MQRTSILASTLVILFTCASQPGLSLGKVKDPFTGTWISRQYTNGREFTLKIQQTNGEIIGWEGRLPPRGEVAPDFRGKVEGKKALVDVTHRRGYTAQAILSMRGEKLVWQLLNGSERSGKYFPLASTLNKQFDHAGVESSDATAKAKDPSATTNGANKGSAKNLSPETFKTEAPEEAGNEPRIAPETTGTGAGTSPVINVSDPVSQQTNPLRSGSSARRESSSAVSEIDAVKEMILMDIMKHATAFETANIGEGGSPSASFNAYKALSSKGVSETLAQSLKQQMKEASPAGKLYLACALWDTEKAAGVSAFKSLLSDTSSVKYITGCEVSNETVAGIAKSFLERGAFLDFPTKKYPQ